tara:strand:- start:890 stop:2104 length:1215 start_codon:yes stop_codon:yes gene_type:complete
MKKYWGATLLVAGTCIGSGMLALPMVLSKLGLLPSFLLMGGMWILMYYTALVSLELNLQAGQGLSLGSLGRTFSGAGASVAGVTSLKLLSYALLAVFLDGGSSILARLFASEMLPFQTTIFADFSVFYVVLVFAFFLLPMRWIDYLNRFLFLGLISIVGILMIGLVFQTTWKALPLVGDEVGSLKAWAYVIPIVFTSFGFHVVFHTLTNYCHKDKNTLKKVFFWGSLIPALVYTLWTFGVLGATYEAAPDFYRRMVHSGATVGDLVQQLSHLAPGGLAQKLIGWLSTLAILTSVLGVGRGLIDTWDKVLENAIPTFSSRRVMSVILTLGPAYSIACLVPNAFITVLGFAGMILVVIAIALPLFLLGKVGEKSFFYPFLQYRLGRLICYLLGVLIFVCEMKNLWN